MNIHLLQHERHAYVFASAPSEGSCSAWRIPNTIKASYSCTDIRVLEFRIGCTTRYCMKTVKTLIEIRHNKSFLPATKGCLSVALNMYLLNRLHGLILAKACNVSTMLMMQCSKPKFAICHPSSAACSKTPVLLLSASFRRCNSRRPVSFCTVSLEQAKQCWRKQ